MNVSQRQILLIDHNNILGQLEMKGNLGMKGHLGMKGNLDRQSKIRSDIFGIPKHQQMGDCILVLPQFSKEIQELHVRFLHEFNDEEYRNQIICIRFGDDYPYEPPVLNFDGPSPISPIFLHSQLLDSNSWKPETQLIEILKDIYEGIDNYQRSEFLFERNWLVRSVGYLSNAPKLLLNSCHDDREHQIDNMNQHFRAMLSDVFWQVQANLPPLEKQSIQRCLRPTKPGFSQIRAILSHQQFRIEVLRQIDSGQLLNKIIKSIMAIKSKKLMIKCYPVIISAVEDPKSFTGWDSLEAGDSHSYSGDSPHSLAQEPLEVQEHADSKQSQVDPEEFHVEETIF